MDNGLVGSAGRTPNLDSASTPISRVAAAGFIGTAIEYYDFFIYSSAAALVFPQVFFPTLAPTVAAVAALATLAASMLSRPVGAVFFGHFGDRFGRKKTLIVTLLMMGGSTFMIGILPSAASIGPAAPVILVTMRLAQGFAVGGEWAGSAVFAVENAPSQQRGRYGMFTQLGVGAGTVLAYGVFLLVNLTVGEKSSVFLNWGWRLPFLLSALLIVFAFYIRRRVAETTIFTLRTGYFRRPKVPLCDVMHNQLCDTLLVAGVMVGPFVFSFVGSAFLLNYANAQLGYSRALVLSVAICGGLTVMAFTAMSAWICDTFGRRRIIITGFILAVPWSCILIPLLDTRSPALFAAGIIGTKAILGVSFGPLGSFIPEMFPARCRYTGAGVAANLGGILGSAIPALSFGGLLASFGSWTIGLATAVMCSMSLLSTYLLPETRYRSLLIDCNFK